MLRSQGPPAGLPDGQRFIFVTGAYRSGTTLLQHLFDGHPDLQVFPTENCLYRDLLKYERLPYPRERRMPRLEKALDGGGEAILMALLEYEKTALPLARVIELRGSTGDQDVETSFRMDVFKDEFVHAVSSADREGARLPVSALYRSYLAAYFAALGDSAGAAPGRFVVNKCPDAGLCIGAYLKDFPGCRVIHLLRDPRGTLGSLKVGRTRDQFLWFPKLRKQAKVVNLSFEISRTLADCDQVHIVRYEDLVSDVQGTMEDVSSFLGIRYDPVLCRPSVLGQPWASNTSVRGNGSQGSHDVVKGGVDRFRETLNELELRYIEHLCGEALRWGRYQPLYATPFSASDRLRYHLAHARSSALMALGHPMETLRKLRSRVVLNH